MIRSTLLLGLLVTALGCGESGPPLFEATGSVTFRGNPVENASVTFQPEGGQPAVGRTDAQGNFQLTTRGRPGVAPGPSKVAITSVEAIGKPSQNPEMGAATRLRSLIPVKYSKFESSGLTANVQDSGENNFVFELTQ